MVSTAPTLRELEQALLVVAHIVARSDERRAEQFAPLLDRLEREVEAARRNGATARAKRILEQFRDRSATTEPIRLTSEPPRQIDDISIKGSSI